MAWKKSQRPDVKKGTLAAFKSACSKYRAIEGIPDFTPIESERISRFLKGIRNQRSEHVRNNGISLEDEGKRHLKYEEYHIITKSCMEIKGKFASELHLGVVLSWNLCARSDTCSGIHSTHLDWEGDCLIVSIAKSKRSYQEDGILNHVYANYLFPYICPVLSLAVHCATNSNILSNMLPLFHESKSENAGFSRLFKQATLSCGLQDLGWHSIRKGALTYGSTGTPDCATWAAIQSRARWKLGADNGVVKRYVKFDPAGDQFIGRLLSGLKVSDKSFSSLSPHIKSIVSNESLAIVEESVLIAFGTLEHPSIKRVAPFLLANLVYHFDFLENALPQHHRFWKSNAASMSSARIETLKSMICTDADCDSMKPRGVPVSVNVLSKLGEQDDKISRLFTLLEDVRLEQQKLNQLIPLSAAASGTMVGERQLNSLVQTLRETIRSEFQSSHLASESRNLPGQVSQSYEAMTWTWGGRLGRLVPETFI
jgi:hypothetical protein